MQFSKIFSLTLLLATLVSCAMPRIYVDNKLKSNATEYVVEGRQSAFKKQMTVGKFAFTNVKRGWTTTSSSKLFFKKQNEAKSKLSFKMKYKGMEAETFCAAQAKKKSQRPKSQRQDYQDSKPDAVSLIATILPSDTLDSLPLALLRA